MSFHEDGEGVPPTTLREVSLLRMLSRDPRVVRLLDVKQGQNKEGKTVLYLVFEYMDTDLKKYILSFRNTGGTVPPPIIKSLMYQLCKGVAFFHGHGVIHRDLKPHNLLMDRKTTTLKIADLGLAPAFVIPIKKYTHEVSKMVVNVKIIRNKQTNLSEGYGFVEFVNRAAVERTLAAYNGTVMPQTEQAFRVNWASLGAGQKKQDDQ